MSKFVCRFVGEKTYNHFLNEFETDTAHEAAEQFVEELDDGMTDAWEVQVKNVRTEYELNYHVYSEATIVYRAKLRTAKKEDSDD